jgi:hypothetical protein
MSSLYQRFDTQTGGFPVPGPQTASADGIAASAFFTDWQRVQAADFDFIVIGTGPAGVAFIERTLARNPQARILVLERGGYWLPTHYQMLPLAFQAAAGAAPTTYPWTRSTAMATSGARFVQAGTIPMLGGRSTCWGGWCPAPQPAQLRGWPEALVERTRKPGFWDDARAFLQVTSADRIDDSVYGCLQRQLDTRLRENAGRFVPSALDAFAAPLAVASSDWQGMKFDKFSSVGILLGLQQRHPTLSILDRCVVELLLHDGEGRVSTLETSHGPLAARDARIVLAMGTIPPATLLMNSFGALLPNAGQRYTGHFMSRFTARVKRSAFRDLSALELGAHYLHGQDEHGMQYHVQVSAFASSHPERDAATIAREAPDAAAAPSPAQLRGSEEHVLFVCTTLGEIGEGSADNWIRWNGGIDPTTNVSLQLQAGTMEMRLWDVMDDATCQTVEALASRCTGAPAAIEYWIDEGASGCWQAERPPRRQVRQALVVDEASPLWIGDDPATSVVGLDYRPHGVRNVYVTGGALFPTAGSWNPTLMACALAQDLADRLG